MNHLINNKQLYLIIASWVVAGVVMPKVAATIWSVVSFALLLRSGDQTRILLAFLAMLILSDSRSSIFAFAQTAKIFIVIILFISIIKNYREYKVFDNRIFRYFLPFLIFSMITSIWSFDLAITFQRSISFLLVYFSVPLLYMKAVESNPKFNTTLMWFVVFLLGLGLAVHFFSPEFTTIAGRFRGLLGNPNGMGLFLLIAFLIGFLTWQRHKHEYDLNKLAILFLLVFGLSLVLSGSRAAIFSILIFVLFNRLRIFTNLGTLVAFLALVLSYELVLARLPQIIVSFGLEEYFRLQTLQEGSGRNVAWTFAWQNIEDVFYAGGGIGYTESIYRQFGAELSRMGHQGNAHSSYLTIWLDSGIVGLVLFLFGIIATVMNAVANSKYTLPMAYALLFTTYFESWLAGSFSPYVALFLILLTALQQETEIIDSIKENHEEPIEQNA